jgi:hypothetical protein
MLINHPYPSIEGELLIYQNKEEGPNDGRLHYSDYSLKKRQKLSVPVAKLTAERRKKIEED